MCGGRRREKPPCFRRFPVTLRCHGWTGSSGAQLCATVCRRCERNLRSSYYRQEKKMEAAPSGTGVFYQAMPATGADGKKIMKLIPVQMVNGQFVQTRASKPRADRVPRKAVPTNVAGEAAVGPPAQPLSRMKAPHVGALSSAGDSGTGNSTQLHTVNYFRQVQPNPAISTNCGELLQFPNQFPLTVKSPALPRGQYLQIPPNAQVQSVPACQLPPAIKNQIFTSQEMSCNGPGSATVLYVSPVTTVDQGSVQPGEFPSHPNDPLGKDSSHAHCGAPLMCAKPHLKLIPKVSQKPNSPTRWVVEEVADSAAAEPEDTGSASVASRTFQTLLEGGNSDKERGVVFQKAGLHASAADGGGGESTDLGEKLCAPRLGTSGTVQAVGGQREAGEVVLCQTGPSGAVQAQDNALVMFNGKVFFVAKKCSLVGPERKNPGRVDEVIDLCNDDAQDDRLLTSPISQPEEDTVIFVSYCPPKSQFPATPDVMPVTDDERAGRSRSNRGTPDRSAAAQDNAGLKMESRPESTIPRLDSTEAGAGPENPTPQRCSQSDGHKVVSTSDLAHTWMSPLAPKRCQMTDRQLRQSHGITAGVQVLLRRADEAATGWAPSRSSHHPSGKLALSSPQGPNPSPPGSVVDTGTPPENHKCRFSQTSVTEAEPLIGYLEPIDESFLMVHESGDPAAQTCAGVSANTRRLGRMRKRTICPCCSQSALDPTRKAAGQFQEYTLAGEQVSKKGSRTKTLAGDQTCRHNCSAGTGALEGAVMEKEADLALIRSHLN